MTSFSAVPVTTIQGGIGRNHIVTDGLDQLVLNSDGNFELVLDVLGARTASVNWGDGKMEAAAVSGTTGRVTATHAYKALAEGGLAASVTPLDSSCVATTHPISGDGVTGPVSDVPGELAAEVSSGSRMKVLFPGIPGSPSLRSRDSVDERDNSPADESAKARLRRGGCSGLSPAPIPVCDSQSIAPYSDTCFMESEDAALLDRHVALMIPVSLCSRRLQPRHPGQIGHRASAVRPVTLLVNFFAYLVWCDARSRRLHPRISLGTRRTHGFMVTLTGPHELTGSKWAGRVS